MSFILNFLYEDKLCPDLVVSLSCAIWRMGSLEVSLGDDINVIYLFLSFKMKFNKWRKQWRMRKVRRKYYLRKTDLRCNSIPFFNYQWFRSVQKMLSNEHALLIFVTIGVFEHGRSHRLIRKPIVLSNPPFSLLPHVHSHILRDQRHLLHDDILRIILRTWIELNQFLQHADVFLQRLHVIVWLLLSVLDTRL